MEVGEWVASIKEVGGRISSRSSGGTSLLIYRLNGHCYKIRITAAIPKGEACEEVG